MLLLWLCILPLVAQEKVDNPAGEPEMVSIFPMGGRQGSAFQVEVRGRNLEGTYALWSSSPHLQARVEAVEDVEDLKEDPLDETKKKKGRRVLLHLGIDPETGAGNYPIRLVSPRGVSNALSFNVVSEPVIREIEAAHQRPDQAQQVDFPVIVNGRLSQGGEVDYYGFDVVKGQQLVFELTGSVKQLGLYEARGSWFDPKRAVRLAVREREKPRLRYRFQNGGHYLLQVQSFFGDGGRDMTYQLRIAPPDLRAASPSGEEMGRLGGPRDLVERTFTRRLEPDRLQLLWSRSIQKPASQPTPRPGQAASGGGDRVAQAEEQSINFSLATAVATVIQEKEPNESPGEALEMVIPTIIEGTVGRPGDVDCFRFQVEQGDQLAFEVETPQAAPSLFNPRLGVSDEDGNEFLTNIHKRIVRNFTFYQKDVQPKTVYAFKLGGEYFLKIRDLTSRHGDPTFLYRVLIRPQVPHAGEVQVLQDRVNLKRGSARKLTLITEQEEGFDGEIALSVENLPEGVDAYPGTDVEPDRGPPLDEGYKERFVPKTQKATLMLFARADALLTRMPQFVRLRARPVIGGQPGELLKVREVPLMVVEGDVRGQGGAP